MSPAQLASILAQLPKEKENEHGVFQALLRAQRDSDDGNGSLGVHRARAGGQGQTRGEDEDDSGSGWSESSVSGDVGHGRVEEERNAADVEEERKEEEAAMMVSPTGVEGSGGGLRSRM